MRRSFRDPIKLATGHSVVRNSSDAKQQKHRPYRSKGRHARALPYLALVRAPTSPSNGLAGKSEILVASYNVHRWAGSNRSRKTDPTRASFVIAEMDADIVALQEALRPFDSADPLEQLAEDLGLHLAFVTTRVHRMGEVGNAVLSRWPITSVFALDLTHSRVERRSAVAIQCASELGPLSIVATHLSLVDRTRHRQVRSILEHPLLQGPVLLMGDMNAWRRCKASRALEKELVGEDGRWPRTFPAGRPLLALDRVYARGAKVVDVAAYSSKIARNASDHLPVKARIKLEW